MKFEFQFEESSCDYVIVIDNPTKEEEGFSSLRKTSVGPSEGYCA